MAPQAGPKAGQDTALVVSIDGPNDGLLFNQRTVGEVSFICTYLAQFSSQKFSKDQATEANAPRVD